MTNATFSQAAHILRIVEEKGTSKSQLQDIIGAGLLADLLDANLSEVNRDEFRRVIGLKPLSLRYDPDAFFRTRFGLWVYDSFRNLVVAKATSSSESRTVTTKSTMLERDMTDAEIEEMLGSGYLFTEDQLCDIVAEMIEKQDGGKEGKLLNNGYANLFYLSSCVVLVRWNTDNREWLVNTWRRDDYRWFAGYRVFSPGN